MKRILRPANGRLALALFLASAGLAAGVFACGSSSSNDAADGGESDTGTGGGDGSVAADGTVGGDDSGSDADGGADTGSDAHDAAVGMPATCKQFLAANPGAPTGFHTIDPDGAGPMTAISVWCDMTFDNGGWTLVQSFTGADSPSNFTVDAGAFLVGAPQPGHLGGMAAPVVQALAENSAQVHIRLSFDSDAGSDGGTWITSRVPDGGAPTLPIANLRNLDVLNKDSDGGFDDWTGPFATAEKLAWVPQYGGGPTVCGDPVQATKYPSIYWACGNFTSMDIYGESQGLCRWTFNGGGNQPMEVYIR